MLKAIMFDLDGTLLPMDQSVFTKAYFRALAEKMAPHGYEPQALIQAIWAGTAAMVRNDGQNTNEAVFWRKFADIYGEERTADISIFDSFYRNEFEQARQSCGFDPRAQETVQSLKRQGFTLILASNPVFPQTAQQARLRWAGVDPSDFIWITSYETAHFCKPNPAYYREILDCTGFAAEECLIVGNDVCEDMIARDLGMRVFLLTNCLINKEDKDISAYPGGDFDELLSYIQESSAK